MEFTSASQHSAPPSDETTRADQRRLQELLFGTWIAQSLSAAARLGVLDQLSESAGTAAETARALELDEPSLSRLMRLLAGYGVLASGDGGTYRLTGMGRLLTAGSPRSMKHTAIMYGDQSYEAWGSVEHSIRTGEQAFAHRFGMPFFEYLSQDADSARTFGSAMAEGQRFFTDLCEAYPLRDGATVVDLGGGDGTLLSLLMATAPGSRGILFERAQELAGADSTLADKGVRDRCELVEGDLFRGRFPEDADLYVLSRVLHDWADEECLTVLANCRRAMDDGSRLMVVERLVTDRPEDVCALAFDLHMMVTTGGRERTEEEYEGLLRRAGLTLEKVSHVPMSPMAAMIARPV